MTEKGLIVIISAPSGCGKGTVLKEVFAKYNKARYSISATTRNPRDGEKNGVEYHFLSKADFENRIKNNQMLEYAEYCGNFYGTPKDEVYKTIEQGFDVILEIEVQGAEQVKKICPEAVTIFVMPPSLSELEKRLIGRQTEDMETIQKRIDTAKIELEKADKYDFVVLNDEVETAADKIISIIKAQRCAVYNNKELIYEVKNNA